MITKANITGWKWRFTKLHIFELPWYHGGDPLVITSQSGNELVKLQRNTLIIYPHYHFDGATYAPDFKNVLLATAVHDALLQLADKYPLQLTTDQAHEAFKVQMQRDGFKLSGLYFFGVSFWFKLKSLLK